MQFITVAFLALVAGVLGHPPSAYQDLDEYATSSDLEIESAGPCGPLVKKAVCCKKSLLGLIDLQCHRPKSAIETGAELVAACTADKKMARCCILGALGTYILCKPPHLVATELEYFDNMEDTIEGGFPTMQYDDLELL